MAKKPSSRVGGIKKPMAGAKVTSLKKAAPATPTAMKRAKPEKVTDLKPSVAASGRTKKAEGVANAKADTPSE